MTPTITPTDLGPRIRSIRKDRGMTLATVSEASGLSISALSKIENSQTSPTYGSLHAIAQGLGVGLVEVIREPEPATLHAVSMTGEAHV